MKFLHLVLFIATVFATGQTDVFTLKSLEIASHFLKFRNVLNLNQLQINIRQILERNYFLGSVSQCKLQVEKLLITEAIEARGLNKRTLKENSREVVKEIIKFGQEHPGISANLLKISKQILEKVKNLKLDNLGKDSVIFPILYSLGFLTTGYVLGIFKEIQEYFINSSNNP
jgi:hypothetical protein